ncbi:cytoskeletal protein CcmA (bactofilin family) [Pseudoalteromonas sp. MBR-15]|uniref:bactofilin family protein n=1 Tax=Pseudoalteromonas sp. MT33b TaxID=2759705 RepID=UPI0015F939EA|nr:polymer-forming cytoskeletal protein [Pseudoalteromonas sp. MT33b]QMW13586.1 polymer-forming cytoskeletal protein [Pseudoalteromonas sp. MT33b]
MFGKKKQAATSSSSSLKRTNHTPSIIAEDMRLTGSLTSQGEVQLDGRIEGDLRVKHLVIGLTGMIEGMIEADSVVVKGKIIGSLIANKVMIESSAEVHGDVFHDTLSIEAGAMIEGSLKHRHEEDNVAPIKPEASEESTSSLLVDDDNDLSFVNKQAADKS